MSFTANIKKVITAVCVALIIAVQTALPVYAADTEKLDSIFSDSMQSRGADEFFDNLGYGQADWLAVCRLRLYGAEGTDSFIGAVKASAEELMKSEGFVRPTELQRAVILLSFAGECPEELMCAAVYRNGDLARQGFNAYLWALIALNCGNIPEPQDAVNTKSSLAEYILSKQLADGGFALKGTAADTDITATAIYALAPLKDNEKVAAALVKAEQCLTLLQLENGGYMTIGIENCESAAQAIIAFTALGYDENDSRVKAAYSAMTAYATEDGFAHLPEGDTNGLATVQAAEAITALILAEKGEALFTAAAPRQDLPSDSSPESSQQESSPEKLTADSAEAAPAAMTGAQIKLVILTVLGIIAAAAIAAFFITKRRKTALLWTGVLSLAAGIAVCLVDIRTPEEYYSHHAAENGITVTVSVDCGTTLNNMERIDRAINPPEVIPADGIVIYPNEVSLPENSTAFDALVAAAKRDRVQVDYTGTSYGLYVSGIGYIYEFGFGASSGWLYRVNGKHPAMSSGAYTLSDGDVVEFVYTCEMGDVRSFTQE